MTDQASLERGYRRLLGCYPRAFRREHGQEILAVLMACATDGQRRPALAESADLISSGLWMRLRPGVPRSARTVWAAVRFMYAGAAISTVNLIMALAFIGDIRAYQVVSGHRLTAAQVSRLTPSIIMLLIASCLVPVILWVWMARANGQSRRSARGLSTALFGLATLDLTGAFGTPGIRVSLVPVVYGPALPVLTWLAGLAAVWLLWRPASSAFFDPGLPRAMHQAQMAELARLRSSRARLPRQV